MPGYECEKCLVKFSRVEDFGADHRIHPYHTYKLEIAKLYKMYSENKIKWRIDPSIRDNLTRWKARLIKLTSDKDIRLDFDVFVNVLFEPNTYFEYSRRDDEFMTIDEESPLSDFIQINEKLSRTDILIQLKMELISIGVPSVEITSFILYKFNRSEFFNYDTGDEADRRASNLLEWYRGIDSSTDSDEDEDVSNFIRGKLIVRQYKDRYIYVNHNNGSLIILFPWGFDKIYLVKYEYVTFIHKCIIIFYNLWKLSISVTRYLIQFLLTGILSTSEST